MKKHLLLVAAVLLAGGAASAQTLVLKSHGNTLTDGERVNIASYWDEDMEYFNPELTLTSTTGGSVTATTSMQRNECSPALQLDEDGFEYQYGIGNGGVQMCSFTQCEMVYVGKDVTQTGTLEANSPHDMLIELVYTIGYDDPGLDNKTIDAEFTVKVEQGGESLTATFYVDLSGAGIGGVEVSDNDAETLYYDLQGRRVANPGKGLYIKRQGATVSKVIL